MPSCLNFPKYLRRLVGVLIYSAIFPAPQALAAQPETPEIVFTGFDAQPLAAKATQLGNAVAIYEYVHNQIEFTAYHGSRSGSVNTFTGQRGSDVDIATALIAMLRSQNMPARYAVATIRVPVAQLTNWLGIGNLDVAIQVLKDQGIQAVTLAADRSTVDLEHTWTEVLVPFDQYRGLTTSTSVDCSLAANASRCNWVPLDGSFKQKAYNGLNIDPYNALSFDYAGYYNAIKNSVTDILQRKDKNPLTILEEQVATWLRTSNPGKTLDDVADVGKIIEIRDGLLPASLPYTVIGTTRHYDSVALHDAAVPASEPKKWAKSLSIDISIVIPTSTTPITRSGGISLLLAQLNTDRLTLTTEYPAPGNTPNMVTRFGGVEIARPLSGNGTIPGYTPTIGDPFTITVSMDGRPDPTGGSDDHTITANYSAAVGGYYLIAAGGEYSNWSQVNRAADQLLADNKNYPVVFNPADPGSNGQACDFASGLNCTPYVDATGNGWDAADLPLLQNKPALDAMTGGLLYVASTQYYAKLREYNERADHLMKTETPIVGFLGVVSSVYDVEYIDSTAFAVLPGGLLIDIKGVTFGGSYRTKESAFNYSNRQFEFFVHMGSSLEHEIWQELTGYDAVSTVRGIQMALAGGGSLINVKRDAITNTVPSFLNTVGFGASAPSPFTLASRNIYGTNPISWSHPTTSGLDGFDGLKKNLTGASDPRIGALTFTNNFWDANLVCFDDGENTLNNLKATSGGSTTLLAGGVCGASWPNGTTVDTALVLLQNAYNNFRSLNPNYFNYLDAAQGFNSTDFGYRSKALESNGYSTSTIRTIRNDLLLLDTSQFWVDYSMPSTLVTGPNNRFEVYIRKEYEAPTGWLNRMTFRINNRGN